MTLNVYISKSFIRNSISDWTKRGVSIPLADGLDFIEEVVEYHNVSLKASVASVMEEHIQYTYQIVASSIYFLKVEIVII